MADFLISDKKTGGNEGGYANNPKDRGRETINGISRRYHPTAKVWLIVDEVKRKYIKPDADLTAKPIWKLIDAAIAAHYPQFKQIVKTFYRANFWNVNRLDGIKDQQVADTVYDFGVNAGTWRAADFLQDAYNNLVVSRMRIKNDGDIGPATLSAVNSIEPHILYAEFNRMRKQFYLAEAKEPGQAQFLDSWLSRLKPYRYA